MKSYLRQHCNSFATMSDHAVFSDIFTLNTVLCDGTGVIQQTNQSICTSCDNTIVKKTSILCTNKVAVSSVLPGVISMADLSWQFTVAAMGAQASSDLRGGGPCRPKKMHNARMREC